MADEQTQTSNEAAQTTQTTQQQASEQATTQSTNANAGGQSGEGGFKPITSETELTAWKSETRKSIVKEVQKTLKDEAATAQAKEQGDYKTLAEKLGAHVTELEASLKQRDHDDLRRKVAARHKLPEALAARLAGDDEAALDADATELAKLVTPRQAPNTEVGTGQKGQTPTTSNRPMPKQPPAEQQTKPVYTFDGTPKVPWPEQTRSPGTT